MAHTKTKPTTDLLTFSTGAGDHQTVKIDGVRYELRTSGDFSLSESMTAERDLPLFGELLDKMRGTDPVSDDERADADRLLRSLVATMVGAPVAVLDRLTDAQRLGLVVAFMKLPRPLALSSTEAPRTPRGMRAPSPRGSRGSTVATR